MAEWGQPLTGRRIMSKKPAALGKLDFLFKDAKAKFWVAGGCFIGIVTGST